MDFDFNDFKPMGGDTDSQQVPQESVPQQNAPDLMQNLDMFLGNENIPPQNSNIKIDNEEQERLQKRQMEAEERRSKIQKKMEEEQRLRDEIRKKAVQYMLEFEEKRQETIKQRRQNLESNRGQNNENKESQGTSDTWGKVNDNIDLKDSEYKGTKDVQRMREAMMNRKNDPNSQPLQNFFG